VARTQADIPIVAEIVRNALVSVANEMKIDLMRSSYNPIVYEMLDFSVGVYNERGETLAQAAGLPEFLCDMPNAINAILADIGGPEALEDGDVYLTNDPYTSTFHLNDVTVVEPVFFEGKLVGFCGARAHWHDMGGKSPGGSTDSTNVYEEGLMLRSIRLQHKGEIDENVIRMIRYNTRLPNAVVGDTKAQLASRRSSSRCRSSSPTARSWLALRSGRFPTASTSPRARPTTTASSSTSRCTSRSPSGSPATRSSSTSRAPGRRAWARATRTGTSPSRSCSWRSST
jgi:hypothetical protein